MRYLLFALLAFKATAADLVWDDPNPQGTVAKYKVWTANSSDIWSVVATVTTNRWTIVLPAGAHKLAVSAIGGSETIESDLSQAKIVIVLIQPSTPRIEQ